MKNFTDGTWGKMENKILTFSSAEHGQIRAMVKQNEVLFVGKDVAAALGYSDTNKAIAMHVDSEDKLNDKMALSLGQRGGWLLRESGLYSLILSSKLPTAKRFKKWVVSEVLPSLRKNGGYFVGQEDMTDQEIMAKALIVAQKTLDERKNQIIKLQIENATMKPKAEYFDAIVDSGALTNFRETAQLIGIPQKKFVCLLMENKYIYRNAKGKLMPYASKNSGLFCVKEVCIFGSNCTGVQTLITPKGRAEFFRLFKGEPESAEKI